MKTQTHHWCVVGEVVVFGHIINSFLSKTLAIIISNLACILYNLRFCSLSNPVFKMLKIGSTYFFIRYCIFWGDCIILYDVMKMS